MAHGGPDDAVGLFVGLAPGGPGLIDTEAPPDGLVRTPLVVVLCPLPLFVHPAAPMPSRARSMVTLAIRAARLGTCWRVRPCIAAVYPVVSTPHLGAVDRLSIRTYVRY